MNLPSHLEHSIPVLTEIISVDDTLPGSENKTADPITSAGGTPENSVQATGMSDRAFEQLEKTVRENVLRELMTRIDFVLEHRVRDGLADVLQTAVDQLAKDIRSGLSKSLEDIIQRTVGLEIAKIQSGIVKGSTE